MEEGNATAKIGYLLVPAVLVLGLLFALYLLEGNYFFALFLLTLAYVVARGWRHWVKLNS